MKKVSVIIPTFNGARTIRNTVQSALDQTYANLEIIVINDGSTDHTEEILKGFGNRIRVLTKPNGGPGSARNMGIRHCTGDYVAMLDHDDLWVKDKIALQVPLFDNDPRIATVFSDAFLIQADGRCHRRCFQEARPYRGFVFRQLFERNFIPNLTSITRKELIEEMGYFDESGEMLTTDDYFMWLKLATRYAFDYIDQPLAYFRQHPDNFSGHLESFCHDILRTLSKTEQNFPDHIVKMRRCRDRRISRLHYILGRHYLRNGRYADSRQALIQSLKIDRMNIKSVLVSMFVGLKSHIGKVRH
ncbi:glycosyltransferase [bacterium]|nr:glycosyltransferase [bacterium]